MSPGLKCGNWRPGESSCFWQDFTHCAFLKTIREPIDPDPLFKCSNVFGLCETLKNSNQKTNSAFPLPSFVWEAASTLHIRWMGISLQQRKRAVSSIAGFEERALSTSTFLLRCAKSGAYAQEQLNSSSSNRGGVLGATEGESMIVTFVPFYSCCKLFKCVINHSEIITQNPNEW